MKLRSWARKHEAGLLIALLVLATLTRLYRVTNPLLDWHAWRQADTASVTREYVKHGIKPLVPKYLDLSNTPSGTDNPNGYRMVEFPLLNIGTASLLRVLPQLPLEQTSRVVSLVFSVLGLAALYGLVRSVSGRTIALMSGLVYAVLPFSVYYGRVVLPEPILIGVLLTSLYAFQKWLRTKNFIWYCAAFSFLLVGYLLKPYTIFFAPVFIALAYLRFSWKMFYNPWLWMLAIIPTLPMLWWRSWITQHPEGIPGSNWLYNGNEIRFKPAWVRWLFFERLNRLISGTLGIILLGANLLKLTKNEVIVYGSWWLGMLIYVSTFATGNVQHDYYQALLIPIVAISLGRGAIILFDTLTRCAVRFQHWSIFGVWLLVWIAYGSTLAFGWQLSGYFPEKILREFVWMCSSAVTIFALLFWRALNKPIANWLAVVVVGGLCIGSVVFSWQYVSGYFNVNHWQYVRAGLAVQKVAVEDDLVIAPNFGDTQLLFQTNRRGWPIGGNIEQKIEQGADWYLSTNRDDEATDVAKRYKLVTETDEFMLFDLRQLNVATPSSEVSL